MKENNKTENMLNAQKASLTRAQKNVLWNRIEADISETEPVPSPFLFSFLTKKPMAPIALLVLLLGGGGTVAAAESARPGDLLFPVDHAVENLRLALASEDKAERLRSEFAEERLLELREIIDEELAAIAAASATSTDDGSADTSTSTSTTTDDGTSDTSTSTDDTTVVTFEAEADVFTDITIVKVEINDRKTIFETDADTRDEAIDVVVDRFDVDRETIERALDFEIEDRASRPTDRGEVIVSDDGEDRINLAIDELLELLGDIRDDGNRDSILSDLFTEIDTIQVEPDEHVRIKIDDDDDDRIEFRRDDDDPRLEIRDGDSRIRIREKDGETRIDIDGDVSGFDLSDFFDELTDDNSRDSDDDDNSTSNSSSSIIDEAEADIFTDITTVKVELRNSRDIFFETDADTRAEVVAEIADRTGASEAEVDAVLDFEIEDRASRPYDRDDDDDSDDDSSDSDDSSDDDSQDSSDDDDSSDSSSDDNDSSDDSDYRVRVEVRVEDGVAEVRLEYGDERDEFDTNYTSKAALITELANRSGLSESIISDNLDLEIKD